MKILIPTYENQIDLEKLAPFFKRLESANPQICVYVTDRYGASDIPGYYSVFKNLKHRFLTISPFKIFKLNLVNINNKSRKRDRTMKKN